MSTPLAGPLLGPDFPGPSMDDLREAYGDPAHCIDPRTHDLSESLWRLQILSVVAVQFPTPVKLSGSAQLVSRVFPHKRLVESLQAVFADLAKYGAWKHVHDYAGMYCYRLQRGGSRLSLHAFAAAIDLNAERYPLGAEPDMADPFVQQVVPVFEGHGWTWGGRFHSRKDAMHFQASAGA